MKFAGNNHYHEQVNDYILSEIEQEQQNSIRQNIRIDVSWCCHDSNRCWRRST